MPKDTNISKSEIKKWINKFMEPQMKNVTRQKDVKKNKKNIDNIESMFAKCREMRTLIDRLDWRSTSHPDICYDILKRMQMNLIEMEEYIMKAEDVF